MQEFDIPLADRIALAPYHREFQVTVAMQANKLMGIKNAALEGIGNYSGGVRINGQDIIIFADNTLETRTHGVPARREEIAVAYALKAVSGAFKTLGAKAFIALPANPSHLFSPLRDPLRDFFAPAGIKL